MASKRSIALGAAIVVVLALGAVAWGGVAIGNRLFTRTVERTVGVDRSRELPDGLHVYVCGSGSPLPDAERAGPCLAVLAGRDAFVIDAGSGSVRKLMRMGFPIDRLRGVYLSHLHSDHIDGLGELLLQAWVGGHRGEPLPVYGPPGTERVVEGLRQAYEIDRGFRVAHHGPKVVRPEGFGGAARILAVRGASSSRVYAANGVTITAVEVEHAPISPAYGFRIDYKGRSVAISGDTVYSPRFVFAARGVDAMFHEALNKPMLDAMSRALARRNRANAAQIMLDIQNYHSTPADAARAAQNAHARALVLYHLVPSIPSGFMEAAFVGNAGADFDGTLKVARDGMIVSLPARSKTVEFDQAL